MKLSDVVGSNGQNSINGIMPECPVTDCINYNVEKNGHIVHTGCKLTNNKEAARPCKQYKTSVTVGSDII